VAKVPSESSYCLDLQPASEISNATSTVWAAIEIQLF
jgi:hypothetical protein